MLNAGYLKLFLITLSSGVHFLLVNFVFSYYLYQITHNAKIVAFTYLLSLPYSMRLLWGPIFDRYAIWGRTEKRSLWIFCLNVLLLITNISFISLLEYNNLYMTYAIVGTIALLQAMIDTNIDAYRIENYKDKELIIASTYSTIGFKVGIFLSGTVILYLSTLYDWEIAFLFLLGINLITVVIMCFSQERYYSPPYYDKGIESWKDYFATILNSFEILKSKNIYWKEILAFILFYKLVDTIPMCTSAMFFTDLGYDTAQIATISRGMGLLISIFGGVVGTKLFLNYPLRKALLTVSLIHLLSPFMFLLMSNYTDNYVLMISSVIVQNFCSGLSTLGLTIYFSNICDNKQYVASQYSLLGSYGSLSRISISILASFSIIYINWNILFLTTLILGIGAFMLGRRVLS